MVRPNGVENGRRKVAIYCRVSTSDQDNDRPGAGPQGVRWEGGLRGCGGVPGPDDTLCDPACGTGGFLVAAHEYVLNEHGADLDPDQKRHLKSGFARGFELVPATGRLCAMNLYLHGMDSDPSPVSSGVDSLAQDPGEHFSMVLTNPPFKPARYVCNLWVELR